MSNLSDFTGSGGGGFTVQSGEESIACNGSSAVETTDVTITAVTDTKAVVHLSIGADDSSSYQVVPTAYGWLTSTTNLRISVYDAATFNLKVAWRVQESN